MGVAAGWGSPRKESGFDPEGAGSFADGPAGTVLSRGLHSRHRPGAGGSSYPRVGSGSRDVSSRPGQGSTRAADQDRLWALCWGRVCGTPGA